MSTHFLYLSLQGTFYFIQRRFDEDDAVLTALSRCLADKPGEFYFDAIYRSLSIEWCQRDDIANPFGDSRGCHISCMWVVDLDNNILTVQKKETSRRVPLERLRNGSLSIIDMELHEVPPPPCLPPNLPLRRYLSQPTWDPKLSVSSRQVAFIGRILKDFSHQWRHVLRSRYNNSTFQKLSLAIIRISSLDFEVKEIVAGRSGMGAFVKNSDLPPWDPSPSKLAHFDRTSVVLCPHIQHSVMVLEEHLYSLRRQHELGRHENARCKTKTYVILTVREVFLYKDCICGRHPAIYTKPERLLNGVDPPSERAMEYLLLLAPFAKQLSPLHRLPLEIQNMVLQNVSLGPVESARVGCLLSLGSPFTWQHHNRRPIKLEEIITTRPGGMGVESQIWFDGHLSGLAYK